MVPKGSVVVSKGSEIRDSDEKQRRSKKKRIDESAF
jgi:hypothetical protein